MTPAARVQAAIGILDDLIASGTAADRYLQGWARANRYAGSKDRKAVADLVYAALRGGQGTGRARIIRVLTDQGAAVAALFDGSRHGPAPLSEAERASLACAPAAPAAPEWLLPSLRRAFGDRLEAELAALNARAPLDLRVNALKATPDEGVDRLAQEGILAEPLPYPPGALRVRGGSAGLLDSTETYAEGLIEIQDQGSQIAAASVEARPGETIVDLCAGAGGKTLALAAAMRNQGRILACDTGRPRLSRLPGRLARAGVTNVETAELPGDWLDRLEREGAWPSALTPLADSADAVLVDAPCSGSGTWRRNPETMMRLKPESLDVLTRLQDRLLAAGARLVRPGGRLVYVTCSVLAEEDEDRAARFLLGRDGWTAAPPRRLTPAQDGTDGFFIARFDRD